MMAEVPSNVLILDKFLDVGIDGISIGSNDLMQLLSGVDRSQLLAALPAIIDGLQARGFRLARLDELLGVAPYLPDCRWAGGA
jgi:phosphoenolpyruvate synthase/pyruvate phosphate dikinase